MSMIDYHHTVVRVWDVVWLMVSIMWVLLWHRWARRNFPLPNFIMEWSAPNKERGQE